MFDDLIVDKKKKKKKATGISSGYGYCYDGKMSYTVNYDKSSDYTNITIKVDGSLNVIDSSNVYKFIKDVGEI